MTTKVQHVYAIGDRVAERPKAHGIVAVREEVKQRIAQYRAQRYGTVVGFNNKPNKYNFFIYLSKISDIPLLNKILPNGALN